MPKDISLELPKQVTISQASKVWGIPEWTLRKYIAKGQCPHRRRFGRIYIPVAKFEEYLKEGDVELVSKSEVE